MYNFEPYDVLQVNQDGKWVDYSTLRSEDDARHAVAYVRGDRGGEFRITRFAPGKGHVPIHEKEPVRLSPPVPKLSETQIDGLVYYLEQSDHHGRAVRSPLWQTDRSLLKLGLIERLYDRDSRYVGTTLTPAAYGAIATYAPEAL